MLNETANILNNPGVSAVCLSETCYIASDSIIYTDLYKHHLAKLTYKTQQWVTDWNDEWLQPT